MWRSQTSPLTYFLPAAKSHRSVDGDFRLKELGELLANSAISRSARALCNRNMLTKQSIRNRLSLDSCRRRRVRDHFHLVNSPMMGKEKASSLLLTVGFDFLLLDVGGGPLPPRDFRPTELKSEFKSRNRSRNSVLLSSSSRFSAAFLRRRGRMDGRQGTPFPT